MQPVNQYSDIFASIRSRSTAVSGVPSLSVQARNFSTIQAARPAGLSESPKASGGSLAVPRSHEIVASINALAAKFAHVVLTQDWHPRGHLSFASSHPGKQGYQTIEASYGTQILWPDHCIQGHHRR